MDRMTHRPPKGHRPATARRAGLLGAATLGASLLCSAAPAQDLAYPRYSPLPVRDAAASDRTPARTIPFAFGAALRVLEQDQGHAIVVLQDGSQVRVRLSDLFIPPTPSHVRPGAAFTTQDRARLTFWDSPLRAEGFLRDGPSAQTRPILQEIGAGGVPALLPVSETIEVPVRADRTVLLAGGLVPMPGETLALLDDGDAAAARPVTLHMIVDGSDYTRDFSQRQLQDLSRMIEAQVADAAALPQVSLTVLFNSGAVTAPETIAPSGLRRILPQAETTAGGTLSSALVAALERLRADIATDPSPDRAHVVLVLLGPGLRADLVDDPAFLAVAEGLRDIPGDIGLLLGAVTPEPSDIPARVLSRLGGSAPTGLVAFGANLGSEVADMVRDVTRTRSAPDIATLCGIAQDRGVPCLSAPDAETLRRLLPVASDTPLDWFAMPLWYVVDGNLLVMERRAAVAGVAPAPGAEGDAADRLAAAQARAKELQVDLTRQQIAVQAMEAQVASLRDAQARAEQDRSRAAEAADAARAETARTEDMSRAALAALEDRAAELNRALADATAVNEGLAGQITMHEADLRAARAALAAAETALDTLRAEVFAVNGRVAALTRDLADAEARALGLETELAEAEAAGLAQAGRAETLNRALAEADAAALAQADRIETLNRALVEAGADRARVGAELAQAQERAALLEAELAVTTEELTLSAADLARRIAQLATQQEEFDTRKVALDAALAEALGAGAQAQADLAARDGQIAALGARIAEGDADRARLDLALEETRRIVAQLEGDVALGDAKLASVIADLDRSRDEVQDLSDRLVETRAALAQAEADAAATAEALAGADQARLADQTALAAATAKMAQLVAARDAGTAALADTAETLAAREAELVALGLRLEEQAAALAGTLAERDSLRQAADVQAAELVEARRMLDNLWADAEASAAGQAETAILQARVEQYAEAILTAEARIGELTAAEQDLRLRLATVEARAVDIVAAHQAELDGLQALHRSEVLSLRAAGDAGLDALRAALAAELSTEQEAHAATRAGVAETEQTIARVLVDLASVLGADLARGEPGQSDLDLLTFLVAEASNLMPRATEMVRAAEAELAKARALIAARDTEGAALRTRLVTLEAEKTHLMERMQVAVGVADENLQLIAIVQEAERMMLAQDETHAAEVEALRQQLAAALVGGGAVAQAHDAAADSDTPSASASVRPQPRPSDLQRVAETPETERQAAAALSPAVQPAASPTVLPGSPLVRAANRQSATVRTGAGFFGN
jgi:chromosome segregation ATPase